MRIVYLTKNTDDARMNDIRIEYYNIYFMSSYFMFVNNFS